MLKSYLVIALRAFLKNWEFSVINIIGLSIGMTVCLILYAWITFELSFDKFYTDAKDIYRVNLSAQMGGQPIRGAIAADGMYDFLKTLSGVKAVTRVQNHSLGGPVIVKDAKGQLNEQDGVYYVDSTFFNVFDYPLLKGSQKNVLRSPESIVITETAARKYFRDADPMQQVLSFRNRSYKVDGVVPDLPSNSGFRFQFLVPVYPEIKKETKLVGSASGACFFKASTLDVSPIEKKINEQAESEAKGNLPGKDDYWRFELIRLLDIHLHSTYEFEMEPVSSIWRINIFSIVAILVLLMAVLNYVNLYSARAISRAREIGVRKVVGALRTQLVYQFMMESLMACLAALCIAYGLIVLMLPVFNTLSGQQLPLEIFFEPIFVFTVIGGSVLIGVLSGVYPSFVVTSYQLSSILKGQLVTSHRGGRVKKLLVGVQYSISTALIFSSLVFSQQFNYLQSMPLGYDRGGMISIPLDETTQKIIEPLKTELLKNGALSVAGGDSPAGIRNGNGFALKQDERNVILVRTSMVDEDLLPTLGIQLVEGRNFRRSDRISTDSTIRKEEKKALAVIINETLAHKFGMTAAEILDKRVLYAEREAIVVGVMSDIQFSNLQNVAEPLVLSLEPTEANELLVRVPDANIDESLEKIRKVYKSMVTHRPFGYSFLSDEFEALFRNERQMGITMLIFTLLSILIIVLGLSSLISFAVIQRMKEMSIRKVLGVSIGEVVWLLSGQFAPIIVAGWVIGLPLTWWLMDNWLDNFAYRTTIGVAPFVTSFLIGFVIYFSIMIIYSFRSFNGNVINALRGQ